MVTKQILTNLKSIQHGMLENQISMQPKKHNTMSKADQRYIMIILCLQLHSVHIIMHILYMNDTIQKYTAHIEPRG